MKFSTLLSRLLLIGDALACDAHRYEDAADCAWAASKAYYQHTLYLGNLRNWVQAGTW